MTHVSICSTTVTVYAIILIPVIISYLILVRQLSLLHGIHSEFSKSFKGRFKRYLTIALNATAAMLALSGMPKLAFVVLVLTSFMWFIPNHTFAQRKKAKK